MCAADKGDNLSLNVLLEAGATINCKVSQYIKNPTVIIVWMI